MLVQNPGWLSHLLQIKDCKFKVHSDVDETVTLSYDEQDIPIFKHYTYYKSLIIKVSKDYSLAFLGILVWPVPHLVVQ